MQKILFAIFGAVILLMDTAFAAVINPTVETPTYRGAYLGTNKDVFVNYYQHFVNCIDDAGGNTDETITDEIREECIASVCGSDTDCSELLETDAKDWIGCHQYYVAYNELYELGVMVTDIEMCNGIRGYGALNDEVLATLYGFCSDGREGYDVSTRSCVACASYQYQKFVENVEIDGVTNYPYFTGHKCTDCPEVPVGHSPNGIVKIDETKEDVSSCYIESGTSIEDHEGDKGVGTATMVTQKCYYNAVAGEWPGFEED